MVLQPFDFVFLRLWGVVPCEVLCSLVHAVLSFRDEQLVGIFLFRQIFDHLCIHDGDRVGKVVVCVSRAAGDVLLTVYQRLNSCPFLFLLEQDNGDFPHEVFFFLHLPSETTTDTFVDDVRGIDVEMILHLVVCLDVVSPAYGNDVLELVPAHIDVISLALCENTYLYVRVAVIIPEYTEQHCTLRFRSGYALALTYLAVEMCILDNVHVLVESPVRIL